MATQREIDRIHLNKKAVPGKIYTGPKGILYYGHRHGHLVQEDLLHGELTGTTLRSKLSLGGDYTIDDIIELLDKAEDEGEAGLSITGARKKKVTNSYLESNEVFMNECPIVLPQEYLLDSITVSTKNNETWTAEIHNDKVPIVGASLSISGTSFASTANLDIVIPQGSKLMFYVKGTSIEKPRITTIYKKPN